MQEMITSYHANLHAPLKPKYKALRRLRREAEERHRMTLIKVHKKEFVDLRKQTSTIALSKNKTYSKMIDGCNGNSKSLFACIRQLLDIKQNTVLPSHNRCSLVLVSYLTSNKTLLPSHNRCSLVLVSYLTSNKTLYCQVTIVVRLC